MVLKLEVGKKYKDGEGNIIEILENDGTDHMPFHGYNITKNWYAYYYEDGRFTAYEDGTIENNLISEIIE